MRKPAFSSNISAYSFFFLIGYILGGIMVWNYRDRIKKAIQAKKKKEQEIGHPILAIYGPSKKGTIPSVFNNPDHPPKGAKRIYPPLHPGGRKDRANLDNQAIEMIKNGHTTEQVWQDFYYLTYAEDIRLDIDTMKNEKRLYIRRMNNKLKSKYQNSKK